MIQRSNVMFVHVRCNMIQLHVLACCVVVTGTAAQWQQLGDAQRIQRFQQLQLQERQMREEGFLDTQVFCHCFQ